MKENKTAKTIITIIATILLIAFWTYVDVYFYNSCIESDRYWLWLVINFLLYIIFFIWLMDQFYGKEETSEDLDDNE